MKKLMKYHLCLTLILSGAALLTGCASSPALLYPEPIGINAGVRAGLQKYDPLPLQKAFAGASDGAYGYSYLGDQPNQVIRSALSNCQKNSSRPCRVLDVSGQPYQDEYAKFGADSQKALTGMRVPSLSAYHFEEMDWHIPSPTQLRLRKNGYHGPTPLAINGAATITTADLAKRLKAGSVTLIDARGWTDAPTPTLPNAYLIDWAGEEGGGGAGRQAELQDNFARVMQLLQPDKGRPVAVFCVSAECWLSVNAAMRLRTAGYTNILWYRGGIEAWLAAKLPTVMAVPYATVWSE